MILLFSAHDFLFHIIFKIFFIMMKKYIEEEREKKDKGITLPSPHNPADIKSYYIKMIQHVLTRDRIKG